MSRQIVSRIDHIFVPLKGAEAAFRFFTETLELTAAWPLAAYGPFVSGGINFGSANLELLQSSDRAPASFTAREPAHIQGIAFEPQVSMDNEFLAELDRRRIQHSPLIPHQMDGKLIWTNLQFTDLVDERTWVFICEYRVSEGRDETARQASLKALAATRRASLRAAGGGRLGVEELQEVVVGSQNPDIAAERWQALLDPVSPVEPRCWKVGAGPSLRLVQANEEAVVAVTARVKSLPEAEAALHALHVDTRQIGNGAIVGAAALGGLDLRLVGASA